MAHHGTAPQEASLVGLQAPEAAVNWTLAQVQQYFDSDGEDLPPQHSPRTSPMRILCFHSFRLSGAILESQMNNFSNITKGLQGAEFSFLNGVHRVSAEKEARMPEFLKKIFPGPYFEWWNANPCPEGVGYDGLQETLDYVQQYIESEGPFDGFLGFSQGGSLAHMLSMLISQERIAIPPPRFLVIISAMASRHHTHVPFVEQARAEPIQIPTLVFMGEKDTEVPPIMTRGLIETIEPSCVTEVVLPKGEHKLPRLTQDQIETCRQFLGTV